MRQGQLLFLFLRFKWISLAIIATSLSCGIFLSLWIRPVYKVSSVISIAPSYFQNSLVREFLSEIYDPTEMKAQRLSAIMASLDSQFLNQLLMEEYPDFKQFNAFEQSRLREEKMRSIEILSLQTSDFQVSVTGTNQQQLVTINQKIIDNIQSYLKNKRQTLLSGLAESMSQEIKKIKSAEFNNADQVLINPQDQFSELHPIKANLSPESQNKLGDIQYRLLEDLQHKLHYINIVLATEKGQSPTYFQVVKSPEIPLKIIWPKKSLFILWSALLGLMFAFVAIFIMDNLARVKDFVRAGVQGWRLEEMEFLTSSKVEETPPQSSSNHNQYVGEKSKYDSQL